MLATLIAHWLASNINPFLVGVWICMLFTQTACKPQSRFVLVSVAGTILATLIAEFAKRHQIWHGSSSFPSGHETFGSSAATCICRSDRRWTPLAIGACTLLAATLVLAGFHHIIDTVAGAVLGVTCMTVVLRVAKLKAS